MKTRSNRTFVILSLALLVTGFIGLILVVVLMKAQVDNLEYNDLTADSGPLFNPAVEALLQGTQTRAAQIALTLTQTAMPSVLPHETTSTITVPAAVSSSCVWAWAKQDLPDVTTAAQQALDDAGIQGSTVRVEAYGENCLDLTGKVGNFAAMTTDFYVTTKVDNLSDETLAAQVVAIYNLLMQVPTNIMPARPGYLDITMNAGTDSKHLRAMFSSIRAALEQGLTGKALVGIFR